MARIQYSMGEFTFNISIITDFHFDVTRMFSYPEHSHQDKYELFYLHSGTAEFLIEGTTLNISAGDAIIIAPPATHYVKQLSPDSRLDCLQFDMDQTPKNKEFSQMVHPFLHFKGSELFGSLFDSIVKNNISKNPYFFDWKKNVAQMIFSELVLMVTEKNNISESDYTLSEQHQIHIIDDFLSDVQNFSASADVLADMLHISVRQLNRILNKEYNRNYTDIIITRRILYSQWLLRNTDTPIDEIYEKAGYTSKSAFFKVFKERIGVTPTQYRESSPFA